MSAFVANSFTYDGLYSADYGLYIAYENRSAHEIETFNSSIKLISSKKSYFSVFSNVETVDNTAFEMTLFSVEPIGAIEFGEISKWLIGRNGFKKLIIHQPDLEDVYFNCIFTKCRKKHITGYANALILTGECDSPYQRTLLPKVISIDLGSTPISETITIKNNSDVEDYIYPNVSITCNTTSNIEVRNLSDGDRTLIITGLSSGEIVNIDNRNQIITTSVSPSNIFERFNKKWFRLRDGDNEVQITGASKLTFNITELRRVGA